MKPGFYRIDDEGNVTVTTVQNKELPVKVVIETSQGTRVLLNEEEAWFLYEALEELFY